MSVFHGNWDEDPKEFLNSYLQCTAAQGDNFRARQFINYLGVYTSSDADDWFEELPQEEKKDWVAIELSFRKRWLKEEVLSIKETVTIENEPQVLPHSLVLPKFSSVRFSPHFLRTENRTDRIFSELNRTGIELVRTGSTCSVRFQNRFEQGNRMILLY